MGCPEGSSVFQGRHPRKTPSRLRAVADPRSAPAPVRLAATLLAPTLRGYRRSWLSRDALAAATLLVIAVPEQLAISRLAGMPPVTGFYAFIAGSVMFALLGSSRQMSIGADSTTAPLFAVGVGSLAAIGSGHYEALVALLAVMVGVVLGLVWLLRLGWVAELLSLPIITGFLGGVAVVIIVHELPALLGIASPESSTLHRLSYLAGHLDQTHPWSLAIGLAGLVMIAVLARADRRLPGTLVALVAATLLVAVARLQDHGVRVLGAFSHGLPRLGLSALSLTSLGRLAPLAGVVALVVITQSAATSRAFSESGGYDVDVSRDFLGVGAGNVLAGVVGAFPVNASPPRTAAVAAAGGRTQLAGLLAAAAMIVVIPVSGLLRDVPVAILAAVLLFVAARIFPARQLIAIARFDHLELALALLTLFTVALIGVEQGIAVAVALAILDRTRRSAQPKLHVLGRLPGSTSWAPLPTAGHPQQVPGVLVVLFATPLWYGNATHFRNQLHGAVAAAPVPLRLVVLDAAGMTDVDYTGARELSRSLDELDQLHVTFAVARAGRRLRDGLERSGLLGRIGERNLYPVVDEAVTAPGAQPLSSVRRPDSAAR